MDLAAWDPGAWGLLGSIVVAGGALLGIVVNSRGAKEAKTIEEKQGDFAIMQQTLSMVVEDQARQREEVVRMRTELAACLEREERRARPR